MVLEFIKRFVQTEKRWIPTLPGHSLYLRPTVIGTRPGAFSSWPRCQNNNMRVFPSLHLPALGVCASDHAILYILACPAGPYFQHPISLLATTDTVRAWPGGTGGHKFSGNYSPGFLPQREAAAQGYDQLLWLFGPDQRVTEGGAMNVFVVLKRADEDGASFDQINNKTNGPMAPALAGWDVITPPLDGTILPGVTRASCLALTADPGFHATIASESSASIQTSARENGNANGTPTAWAGTRLRPAERVFTMHDLVRWSADGTLLEVFCVGTAAIVAAIRRIGFEGRDMFPPVYPKDEHGLGPVGRALRAKILAIQEGREEYEGWGVVCG